MKQMIPPTFVLALALTAAAAGASEATIEGARATRIDAAADPDANGAWRFDVTLSHADAGWDHYADAWRVIGPDGAVLGTRILVHPHVNEQPFTRSLGRVEIPAGVTAVEIEARDTVSGWAARRFSVTLGE